MSLAPLSRRAPVFRVSGRVRKTGRTCHVEVVAHDGTRYALRREFSGDIQGVIDATRIVDLLWDEGTINPAKWDRVGPVDPAEQQTLSEIEHETFNASR